MTTSEGNELMIGWLNTRIGLMLDAEPNLIARFPFILITAVDSSRDMIGLTNGYQILTRYRGCALVGDNLLVPGGQLVTIAHDLNLFNGFDELWCFDSAPAVGKPPDVGIVAPLDLSVDRPEQELISWFRQSRCRLGLGDGIGVNYVTPDTITAGALKHFLLDSTESG